MNWTKHHAISQGWLCEQLYGNRNASARGKLGHRQTGRSKWTPDELTKLESIRQQLLADLAS